MKAKLSTFALTVLALLVSQTGIAGDPFAQADKQLSTVSKKGIMLARQNPATGETVFFSVADADRDAARALAAASTSDEAREARLANALASLDTEGDLATGKFSGVDSDRSTSAWYGYYYGWYYPVTFVYYRITWYYTFRVYYGGYRWVIYY